MEAPRPVGGVAKLARMRASRVEAARVELARAVDVLGKRKMELVKCEQAYERAARMARGGWSRTSGETASAAMEALILEHKRVGEARERVEAAQALVGSRRAEVERESALQRATENVANRRQVAVDRYEEDREQDRLEETFRACRAVNE